MYERSEKLRALGEKVIAEHPDLFGFIPELGMEIAYLNSDEKKFKPGMQVNADCEKVKDKYAELIPYDFIITFYKNDVPEEKHELLMMHELMHVGWEDGKAKIRQHDVQDFKAIIEAYGTDWDRG